MTLKKKRVSAEGNMYKLYICDTGFPFGSHFDIHICYNLS